jgi:hydroxymethylbilane synthase
MVLRIGTRASRLATWQAEWVASRLTEQGIKVELAPISTTGDRQRQGPISGIGGQGVFTKEIQNALLDRRIDVAVHSLKDLATEETPGLCLAAVPRRASVSDVLVFQGGAGDSIERLPKGAVVGTGSLRRKTQLLRHRPDLRVENIRGNVETRLAKLDEGQFNAVVLAEAGLRRLGFDERVGEVLPPSVMLPAVGQGALGIESREDDESTRKVLLEIIDDRAAHGSIVAERAMLAALHGGCSAPVAGWAREEEGTLRLEGRVLSLDGKRQVDAKASGLLDDPEGLGRLVAEQLIGQGAAELIREARCG